MWRHRHNEPDFSTDSGVNWRRVAWYSIRAMPLFSPVDNSGFRPGHTRPDPESYHTRCLLLEHSSRFGVPNSRRIFVVALSGSTGLLGILCSNFIDNYERLRIPLLQDFLF